MRFYRLSPTWLRDFRFSQNLEKMLKNVEKNAEKLHLFWRQNLMQEITILAPKIDPESSPDSPKLEKKAKKEQKSSLRGIHERWVAGILPSAAVRRNAGGQNHAVRRRPTPVPCHCGSSRRILTDTTGTLRCRFREKNRFQEAAENP